MFFSTILGFTQSHSSPLVDIEVSLQKITGEYKSEKPINITCIVKVRIKGDCNKKSIANAIRELILYSFGPDRPGHKNYKEPRMKLFK